VKNLGYVILSPASKMHAIPEVGERLYDASVRREGRQGPPLHGLDRAGEHFHEFSRPTGPKGHRGISVSQEPQLCAALRAFRHS
jgi:hypothetical protein